MKTCSFARSTWKTTKGYFLIVCLKFTEHFKWNFLFFNNEAERGKNLLGMVSELFTSKRVNAKFALKLCKNHFLDYFLEPNYPSSRLIIIQDRIWFSWINDFWKWKYFSFFLKPTLEKTENAVRLCMHLLMYIRLRI